MNALNVLAYILLLLLLLFIKARHVDGHKRHFTITCVFTVPSSVLSFVNMGFLLWLSTYVFNYVILFLIDLKQF